MRINKYYITVRVVDKNETITMDTISAKDFEFNLNEIIHNPNFDLISVKIEKVKQ